ncbi:MAG: formylglycine-generating enzyme family protein [Magnetospirillum sp.]|nr:formylglycine-generating enzyme family protein [Magnetospirillum sp.]
MAGTGRASLSFLALLGWLLIGPVQAIAGSPPQKYFQECPDCPELVVIPAGTFVMGSPSNEPGRFDVEGPRHIVSVPSFALGKHDVTVEEYSAFLRETDYQPAPCDRILGLAWQSPRYGLVYPPGSADSPRQPAVCVNWDDAQAYVAWLNAKVRHGNPPAKGGDGPYRLPSEAEWEYAARAGTTTTRWWGKAIGVGNANCNGCGSAWDNTLFAPVDSFGPNPFGLYDMLGNVWQWTEDCWNPSYVGAPRDGSAWLTGDCTKRVVRGGSWSNLPIFIRSAMRIGGATHGQEFDYASDTGFRVARSIR